MIIFFEGSVDVVAGNSFRTSAHDFKGENKEDIDKKIWNNKLQQLVQQHGSDPSKTSNHVDNLFKVPSSRRIKSMDYSTLMSTLSMSSDKETDNSSDDGLHRSAENINALPILQGDSPTPASNTTKQKKKRFGWWRQKDKDKEDNSKQQNEVPFYNGMKARVTANCGNMFIAIVYIDKYRNNSHDYRLCWS
jgi:hypothetical protein